MRLRSKLLSVFLAITLLPIFILSVLSFFVTQTNIRENIFNQLQSLSLIQESRLTHFLDDNFEHLNVAIKRLEANPDLVTVFESGNMDSKAKIMQELADMQVIYRDFENIIFLNTAGDIILSTNPAEVGSHYSKEGFFGRLLKENSLEVFRNTKNLNEIHLGGAISHDNKLIGAIIVRKDTSELEELAVTYNLLGKTTDMILVHEADEGKIYLIPRRFESDAKTIESLGIEEEQSPTYLALNGNTDVYSGLVDYRGMRVLASTRYLDSVGWGIVIKIDEEEAFREIEQLQYAQGILGIVFTIFVMISAFYMSRSISEPILKLLKSINLIASGKLDEKIESVDTGDEISDLARALNFMRINIKNMQSDLKEEFKKKSRLKEIIFRRNQKLSTSIKELEDQNEYLEDIKKATINIMEDLASEKVKTEEEKAKDEAILASIGHGVVVTDKEGKVILVNSAALNILGMDEADVLGHNWPHNIKVLDNERNEIKKEDLPIYKALKFGEKLTAVDYIYITKGEKEISVGITATPVSMNKEIKGAIVIFYDRTHEMEVDRMKTEFISLASHQLRTPLSAMKWFTEMLLMGDAGELNKEQKEFIENIQKSNERMIALVNSLLNISRIESGRIIIEPKEIDFDILLQDILKELEQSLKKKNINFIHSINDHLGTIKADPRLLKEVYTNLLTNAIKYTPENGEISLFISKKNDDLVSQVADNGYGIPKEEQANVFTKFYRGTNIRKVATDGSGLGLYLVKAIVESSGGKIWFESEEGKGTTFWFTIPKEGVPAQEGEVTISS